MKFKSIIKTIFFFVTTILTLCMVFTGCSYEGSNNSLKIEVPQPKYTKIGYDVIASIDGDNIKVTYAIIGFKDNEITRVYLDQFEKKLGQEKSLKTNRELGNAYGLAYTSDFGEWYVQTDAFKNYIVGNKMTPEELDDIETYKKDDNNPSLPAKNSDLAAACELNIGDFLDVIKGAANNTYAVEAMNFGVGEEIRIYNDSKQAKIDLAFIATDYNSTICFSKLESFDIKADNSQISSLKEAKTSDLELYNLKNQVEAFEEYMIGRTISDISAIEVYDPSDGINLALPKKDTDLSKICNIDLYYYIKTVSESSGRLG